MAISATDVKTLRERTGAGMMDCKNALVDSDGDIEKAIELLRERGLASAAKKAGRIATEGAIESYIHLGGRIGVLVEVNTDQFKSFIKDVALQIAASNPQYVRREEVPMQAVEKEKEILRAQALNEGKPEKIIDRMVEGRVEKYYKDNCLLEQDFIRDTEKTINDYQNETIATLGEKVSIRRFTRYELGEGLAKREDDFVSEVMKQTGL
jgi:elongation factor Ts